MNPCVYTKIIMIEQDELDTAENLGVEPPIYWEDFSFKIYDLTRYHRHLEEGEEIGTNIEFHDGASYTIKMKFEELRALEDKFYDIPEFIWKNPVIPS